MPVYTSRDQWELIRLSIPDEWITMKELATVAKMAPMRIAHGLMYARTHGLVEEGTRVCVDVRGQQYRKSIYRRKIPVDFTPGT
jgi:hypothetical protein